MPKLISAASLISEVAAADSSEALRHFERLFTLETDCWDVHESLKSGNPDFVLLDVRGQQLFQAGHVPGATNLPHGRINERNLSAYPPDTLFVVYCGGAALQWSRSRRRQPCAAGEKGEEDDRRSGRLEG